jgi:hypothetical protein
MPHRLKTMSLKKQYPTADGWIHASFTLKSDDPIDLEGPKHFCTNGNIDAYEIPVCEQKGKKVKIIVRKRQPAPVTEHR